MTTLADALREHDIAATESQVVAEFRALLGPKRSRGHSSLTVGEEQFLLEHGGVPAASPQQLQDLTSRSSARALAEAADSLSRTETAELLGTDVTRVSHRTREGALYSYVGASRRRRYPGWQFVDGTVLPHLREVVAALPDGLHPVTVRSFFTTPDDALLLGDEPVSPAQWLACGGAPDPVAALARTAGEQV